MEKDKLRGIASFLLDEKNVYTSENYTYDDFFNLSIAEQKCILNMINWVSKRRHCALKAISKAYSIDEEKHISKEESEEMTYNKHPFPIGEA